MFKAIFIDIDGTLRDNNKNISKRTIESIKKMKEKGILVIISSGRPRKYTENISKECFASRYIITSSGAEVFDYEENKSIFNAKMDIQACIKLYNIAQENGTRFIMSVGDYRVVNRLKYNDGSEILLQEDIEYFLKKNDVLQCVISDSDFNKVKRLRTQIEKVANIEIKNQSKCLINENVEPEGSIYYDIANPNISKGNAIEKLCEFLNIDMKDTIAIGDDFNDISMFKVAGKSIVVSNASDDIKKYANEIILSNEEDGVAIYLEKLILE